MENIPFCLFTPPQKGKKIVWEITSQCNMLCKHCCSNSSFQITPLNEFIFSNRKLLKQRIDEMVSFGIKEFYISGGEPFLAKNIFTILKYLKRKNVKISIASNGYFLNETLVKKLSKMKIDLLHLSVDGHLPKIHNFLRGGNFFGEVTKNIKILRKYKIPIRVGCIIWRQNENSLKKMIKLCINLGVKELRFSWLIKVGRFKYNPQLSPRKTWLSIIKEIEKLQEEYRNRIKISIHRMQSTRKNDTAKFCTGGDKLFFLNPLGNLSPCSWINKIDPNFTTKDSLWEEGIRELSKANEILEFKKLIRKRANENFKGCLFMAQYQNGSYYSNDNLFQ